MAIQVISGDACLGPNCPNITPPSSGGVPGPQGDPGSPGAPGPPGPPGATLWSSIDTFGASRNPAVNSTAAIQAALDDASANGGGWVLVPSVDVGAGEGYGVYGTVTIPSNVVLFGVDGADGNAALVYSFVGSGVAVFQFAAGFNRSGIEGLQILGPSGAPSGHAVSFAGSQFNYAKNLQIWYHQIGIDLSDGVTPFSAYNVIEQCEINLCTQFGIRALLHANSNAIVGGRIFFTRNVTNDAVALAVVSARALSITGGLAIEDYNVGLQVGGAPSFSMSGCWFEKGVTIPLGADFQILAGFAESPFFEGDISFVGNHHADTWPLRAGNVSSPLFGAIPGGTVDSSAALSAALAEAAGTVTIPPGDFLISAPVVVPSGARLVGLAGSRLVTPAGATFAALDMDGVTDVEIRGVTIENLGAPAAGNFAFYVRGACTDILFDSCVARNMAAGFVIRGDAGTVSGTSERISYRSCRAVAMTVLWGFEASQADVVDYIDCHAWDNWLDGFKVRALTQNVTFSKGSALRNGVDPANAGDGIDAFAGGDTFVIDGTVCNDNEGNGIVIKTDDLTRDDPAQFGYVRRIQVTNVRCRGNDPGYGMTLEVFRNSRNSYFDNPPANDAATIPMPVHALVTGGIFEENAQEGIWVDGHNIVLDGVLVKRNGEHGLEVGVRSINVTLRDVMSIANGQSGGLWNGVYLRGKHIRMYGGHVFGVDPDIVRTEADLVAAVSTHERNVLVDSAPPTAFAEDIVVEGVIEDFSNASQGIRANMDSGLCVIKQIGAGSPINLVYGGIGSEWIQNDLTGPDGNLWRKGAGTPNDPTSGWVRIFTPRMIPVTIADFAFGNANFGVGATIDSVDAGSTVSAGRVVITTTASSPAAQGTLVFTFPGGAYDVVPSFFAQRNRGSLSGSLQTVWWTVTASAATIIFVPNPGASPGSIGFEWRVTPFQGE